MITVLSIATVTTMTAIILATSITDVTSLITTFFPPDCLVITTTATNATATIAITSDKAVPPEAQ
jgi:hypothetical protein